MVIDIVSVSLILSLDLFKDECDTMMPKTMKSIKFVTVQKCLF